MYQAPVRSHRCVHVLAGLGFGGNESIALRVLEESQLTFDNHLVLLSNEKKNQEQRFASLSRKNYYYPSTSSYLDKLTDSFRWIKEIKPTAILSYTFNINIIPLYLAARILGIPNLRVRVGNTAPHSRLDRFKWGFILWFLYLLRVTIHPCSQTVMDSIQGLAPLRSNSQVMINGCDVEAISLISQNIRTQRPTADRRRILMVARLDPIKNQSLLIRTFARLSPQFPNWDLWLVGDGSERSCLEELAIHLGLDPQAIFLGQRGDIPELLGQSDIFAFSTTEAEGFGIALIEAMAAGLPIVASDVGACREVLLNGGAGQLVPEHDLDAWESTLATLMRDPEQRQKWSAAALANSQRYDIIKTATEWISLLCQTGT